MRIVLIICWLLIGLSSQAQNLKIKSNYQDKSARNISFKTSNIKGYLSATNAKLKVRLKNISSETMIINAANCSLVDKSGQGTHLCAGDLALESGNSITLFFENCAARNYNDGIFGLKNFYSTKSQFKEDSFFLKNKEFILDISGERILFYTD
tara:strand:+ start:102 stop:560 length:459 start_codon:yes stop_codon:yes gene_type:complete